MNTRFAAVILIGGIGLLAASIPRSHTRGPAAKRTHATERPWLTRDAQDQLIGADGRLGPLFDRVTLGGPAPSPEARAAIAQFAKDHAIDIRLEVRDDTLVAIRASITFGGCCGYEAVDVIGRRLDRPRIYDCCDCGQYTPVDDWAYQPEPGVHVRFHARVNTLTVRWEPALGNDEVLAQAEALVGRRTDKLAHVMGDRWIETVPHEYALELPYDPMRSYEGAPRLGVRVASHAGVVNEVAFELRADEGSDEDALEKLLRARWGRPRVDAESGELTWHRGERVITASVMSDRADVTITSDERVALQ